MSGIVREARVVRGPGSDVRSKTLNGVDSSLEFFQLLVGVGGENLQESKQLANALNPSTRRNNCIYPREIRRKTRRHLGR